MKLTEVLQMTIAKLGANYNSTDSTVLENIVKEVIIQASFISNRDISIDNDAKDNNLKLLSPEIMDAAIIAYENRGVENVKSQSSLGESNTFVDYIEKLRNDIIKNGKRILR
jgi:hypothetical protein